MLEPDQNRTQLNPVPSVRDSRPDIPLVMCVYQRVSLLAESLRHFSEQTVSSRIVLHLWNNHLASREEVEAIVAAHRDEGGFPVYLHHSPENVGGFGRFYFAQKLSQTYPFVVFIDDDQRFATEYELGALFSDRMSETLSGFWGHRFEGKPYWKKVKTHAFGEVEYLGTGGMVADTKIFQYPQCFECPRRFWFVEDLWLSFVAKHLLGWKLVKSQCEIDSIDTKNDQWRQIRNLKNEFLIHLRHRGWQV